ncbi:YceI family protein [Teredinibacter sp. KSP-S5-2]|uniref:YceI family protein n=1 Tax=Teredinibacter sp. KSP-S5-2 TaxID=3034506 RepID=UPI00293482FA|nr:YceI family protein [Teredinibacter sp. KSP-S5-2]WNO09198.1 YceI family protein [Teredinibacter sp. KSP-S5-2]
MKCSITIALLLWSIIVGSQASADWVLSDAGTSLHFISTKNQNIAEVHDIRDLKGELLSDGSFNITLDTRSVNTGIQIRDERMASLLFESGLYPFITISGKVDYFSADDMKAGVIRTAPFDVDLTIDMHGISQTQKASMLVYKVDEKTLGVSLHKPIIIKAGDFQMDTGIERLRKIAGLDNINYSVPVTGHFVFNKVDKKLKSPTK